MVFSEIRKEVLKEVVPPEEAAEAADTEEGEEAEKTTDAEAEALLSELVAEETVHWLSPLKRIALQPEMRVLFELLSRMSARRGGWRLLPSLLLRELSQQLKEMVVLTSGTNTNSVQRESFSTAAAALEAAAQQLPRVWLQQQQQLLELFASDAYVLRKALLECIKILIIKAFRVCDCEEETESGDAEEAGDLGEVETAADRGQRRAEPSRKAQVEFEDDFLESEGEAGASEAHTTLPAGRETSWCLKVLGELLERGTLSASAVATVAAAATERVRDKSSLQQQRALEASAVPDTAGRDYPQASANSDIPTPVATGEATASPLNPRQAPTAPTAQPQHPQHPE
ncbi:hypothetical protein cyc_05570 [Cyclospora cayetanensis]|uniref:Uncharacterized protein n=1 Tax=Cyclospora cayetanensis TaxID=88456 RepID=A0A1D3D2F3_9EIME|nr:hypothetical protein cyc_05570 [Cyclospora cayetanensis]